MSFILPTPPTVTSPAHRALIDLHIKGLEINRFHQFGTEPTDPPEPGSSEDPRYKAYNVRDLLNLPNFTLLLDRGSRGRTEHVMLAPMISGGKRLVSLTDLSTAYFYRDSVKDLDNPVGEFMPYGHVVMYRKSYSATHMKLIPGKVYIATNKNDEPILIRWGLGNWDEYETAKSNLAETRALRACGSTLNPTAEDYAGAADDSWAKIQYQALNLVTLKEYTVKPLSEGFNIHDLKHIIGQIDG